VEVKIAAPDARVKIAGEGKVCKATFYKYIFLTVITDKKLGYGRGTVQRACQYKKLEMRGKAKRIAHSAP